MDEYDELNLPPGVWYEATRKRYRVRLYKEGEVFHLSYHGDVDEALEAWEDVVTKRDDPIENPDQSDMDDQIKGLCSGLNGG